MLVKGLGCFVQSDKTKVYYDTKSFCEVEDTETGDKYLKYIGNETDGRKIVLPSGANKDVQLKSMYRMFEGTNIKSMPVIPYGVEDMSGAFMGCESLEIKSSDKIPSSVRNMSYTFTDCKNITCTPHFDVVKTTVPYRGKDGQIANRTEYIGPVDFTGAFKNCSSLNLSSGFVPWSGKQFDYAFSGTAIESLPDFSKYHFNDTAFTANYMCANCPNLSITGNEIFSVKYNKLVGNHPPIQGLFENCQNITKESAEKFLSSNLTMRYGEYDDRLKSIFRGCKNVYDGNEKTDKKPVRNVTRNINVTSVETNINRSEKRRFLEFKQPNGESIWYDNTMFDVCYTRGVTHPIPYLHFINKNTYLDENGVPKENPLDLSDFKWSDYIKDRNPYDCDMKFEDVPVGKLNSMRQMFEGTSITRMPPILDTVTDMRWAFRNCANLKCFSEDTIPTSVEHMQGTFLGCVQTEYLPDIPDSVEKAPQLASGAKSLKNIPNHISVRLIENLMCNPKAKSNKNILLDTCFCRAGANPKAIKEQVNNLVSDYMVNKKSFSSKSNESDKSFDDGVNREIERDDELKPNFN